MSWYHSNFLVDMSAQETQLEVVVVLGRGDHDMLAYSRYLRVAV